MQLLGLNLKTVGHCPTTHATFLQKNRLRKDATSDVSERKPSLFRIVHHVMFRRVRQMAAPGTKLLSTTVG